jgi:EmrB/QacA subfamily drug resistance transporter
MLKGFTDSQTLAIMTEALPAPAIKTPSILVIFGALILVVLLASLDQTIVSTALPTIMGEFGGLAHLSWIVTSYLLTTTIVGPLYGKLGDLYGRKLILQIAIVIFLAGSALCGISQNLIELIVFRALQGLGGGGLMVTAVATVSDFVSPRDRGRYQGTFGAVFALSTVLGPLIGGFFVDHLSWRWIFYVNLPLGIIALCVISAIFPHVAKKTGRKPSIDYLGIVALSTLLTGLVLATSLTGGALHDGWIFAALAALGLAGLAGFVFIEKRAQEPLMPLLLFKDSTFVIACAVGFIVGMAMFGSITLLPVYLQMVKGLDPTSAGLCLTPMMFGVVITSIASGRLISRYGKYRHFPIIGTATMTAMLYMLATLDIDTPLQATSIYMFVLGLGLGLVMQNLIMAAQNAVPFKYLGVATSGALLFRSIGGLLGVSLFGAIFAFNLRSNLEAVLPGQADKLIGASNFFLKHLVHSDRLAYDHALIKALHPVFYTAAAMAACGFICSLFLKNLPLRKTVAEGFQVFAIPRTTTSLQELERLVTAMADKESRWQVYTRVTKAAEVSILPEELWLLGRLMDRQAPVTCEMLAKDFKLEFPYICALADRLISEKLATRDNKDVLHPTAQGRSIYTRVINAWNEDLNRLLADWSPDTHPEIKAMVSGLAKSYTAAPPQPPQPA